MLSISIDIPPHAQRRIQDDMPRIEDGMSRRGVTISLLGPPHRLKLVGSEATIRSSASYLSTKYKIPSQIQGVSRFLPPRQVDSVAREKRAIERASGAQLVVNQNSVTLLGNQQQVDRAEREIDLVLQRPGRSPQSRSPSRSSRERERGSRRRSRSRSRSQSRSRSKSRSRCATCFYYLVELLEFVFVLIDSFVFLILSSIIV